MIVTCKVDLLNVSLLTRGQIVFIKKFWNVNHRVFFCLTINKFFIAYIKISSKIFEMKELHLYDKYEIMRSMEKQRGVKAVL